MRLVDLDTKVTTWRYNFDKEEYVAVQTTVGEMIDLNTHEGLSIPIIEIPEPHGRLGDLDALHSALRKRGKEFSDSEYGEGVKCGLADAREFIKNAPTVIPASKEGT